MDKNEEKGKEREGMREECEEGGGRRVESERTREETVTSEAKGRWERGRKGEEQWREARGVGGDRGEGRSKGRSLQ